MQSAKRRRGREVVGARARESAPIYFKIYRVRAVLHLIRRQRECVPLKQEIREYLRATEIPVAEPVREIALYLYFLLNNSSLRTLSGLV